MRTLHLLRHFARTAETTLIDIAPEPSRPPEADEERWSYRHDGQQLPHISPFWRRVAPDLWARKRSGVADAYVQIARRHDVDLLMFSVWPLVPTVQRGRSKPLVVWDGDSFSSYHRTRSRAVSVSPLQRIHSRWLASRYKRFERRLSEGVDQITVAGPMDVAPLRRASSTPVRWIPNEVAQVHRSDGVTMQYDFGFLGSGWAPNADGMRWFLKNVWPIVRQARPNATLAVAGNVRTDYAPGVVSLGRVADKGVFYSTVSAVVVPIDYGSGTQQKLLETVELGIPVYTTNFGSESTELPHLIGLSDRKGWVEQLVAHLDGVRPTRPISHVRTAAAGVDELLGGLP
jgi:hypothetical protein